jgi:hypothetical protein
MKSSMFARSSFALLVLMLAAYGHAHAAVAAVPEIDPAMTVSGVALLGGVAMMIRGRRR